MPVFFVPGEHDMLDPDGGKAFLNRFGKGSQGAGWYSFDHRGVHFVALVNVADLKPGGMGNLGAAQLAWLKDDLAGRPSSPPIVVFAHIPLWTVYADWGWGTDDAAQALKLLARFGSVTVLNGHIHQITQKIEGRIAFHTARSTAFPQPAPGTAPSPGPLKVPPEQLHSMLGITDARVRSWARTHRTDQFHPHPLTARRFHVSRFQDPGLPGFRARLRRIADVDRHLFARAAPAPAAAVVQIENFTFRNPVVTVKPGTTVTWTNADDIPHTVTSTTGVFKSKVLDSGDSSHSLSPSPANSAISAPCTRT